MRAPAASAATTTPTAIRTVEKTLLSSFDGALESAIGEDGDCGFGSEDDAGGGDGETEGCPGPDVDGAIATTTLSSAESPALRS